MIRITGIKKAYDGRAVLDIPSLELREGGRYALLGANGSGKTTLIRILAGQLQPDGGSIDTGGISAQETGYMPQTPYAFDMTVLKNVMLAAGRGAEATARAKDVINKLGLGKLMHKNARGLSGGETQRMALARLIVRQWRLLLLDEPAAAADIAATDLIEEALKEYSEQSGCILVFSSHAPSQAARIGTRAVILDAGRIAEEGSTEEVLHSPRTEAAKSFLRHWQI